MEERVTAVALLLEDHVANFSFPIENKLSDDMAFSIIAFSFLKSKFSSSLLQLAKNIVPNMEMIIIFFIFVFFYY